METHVSSTTADVPDTQEVIGPHGNVEIVVAVEKVEEDIQQKADSNSQDNAQPMMEESSPPCSQSTKTDDLHKSPRKQDPLQPPTSKEINKTAPSPIKLQSSKQPNIQTNANETQTPQNKPSGKQVGVVMQNAPDKELPAPADVDSTSPKDIPMDITSDEVDNKNDVSLNITVDRDPSNESQSDMTSDAEKEHNKSISRELKSLINSAKESKIISECTKLTSKTRKSARAALDTSSTNINNTPEADRIQGTRRSSSNSQKSNSSEKSDRVGKRSMRSQNPEFVHKVRKFLNSVTGKFQKDADSDESTVSDEETVAPKIKENATDSSPSNAKNRNPNQEQVQSQSKIDEKSNKLRSDPYCWRCHWSIDMNDGEKTPQPPLKCTVCPRAFHYRCLTGSEKNKISTEKNWVCPECMTVLHAESSETRSLAMRKTTLGMLCELLKYALQRMTEVAGSEPFLQSVDRSVFPDYDKYVVHPMDLALMREHIDEGLYGSTEAFLADAHWILHNSIIFNTLQSKLTTTARALVRSCRAEMGEIEACPECYAAAHARRPTWFTDVCSTPHLLLWAKLKGFPYWPAKAMTVSHAGLVDVRFFGAHDRAWVPARDCYLYCERDPNNFRTKRQDMVEAMQEAEQHIRNISRKYGKFAYAPYRTTFEPSKLGEALKYMIPSFDGQVRSPVRERRSKTPARALKSRSNSKGSKDDSNAGDVVSDSEQMDTETPKTEEAEKKEEKEENVPSDKPQAATRKRTRSEAKGPAESSPKEKRRLLDTPAKEAAPKKTDSPVVSSSKESEHKQHEPDDAAADEPVEADREPAAAAPPPPAPLATDATPKPNKNPKTHNVVASNKTPAKTDVPKTNDKEKNTQQGEKPVPPNQRISRSNKSLNNIETIELDENNPTTTTSNKTSAPPVPPVTNIAKTNPNKVSPKEAVTITKANEKEKTTESAVLIKINDKGNKDASLTITVNAKDKLTEAATLTKITDIVKMTHNKNKIKDKEIEITTPNKDGGKEKVSTVTPNKNAAKTTPSTKNLGSEKTNNDAPAVPNTTTDKTVNDSTVNNHTGKVNAKEGTDKTADTSTESKKILVDKEKSASAKNAFSPKPGTSKVIKATKDRIQYDDDTSLAAMTRKVPKANSNSNDVSAGAAGSGGKGAVASPAADAPPAPPATRSNASKTTPVTVEVNPDSSIFTPTSTDNVRNMKEAVNKLQKLRSGFDPPANSQVGKVGVRAFARITSPPDKQAKPNDVVVEIKSEPMDYEDCDAPQETSTVLDSLRPRPIAPAVSAPNLREVRISKVMPVPAAAKKSPKPPDVRPRAKKTFPQPKKADDGRAELTNKNSMVYIPIQPPISQSPVRAALKAANSATVTPPRTPTLFPTANVKSVTSIAPPLLPMAPPPPPPATTATATSAVAGAILAPGFPSVPTTVHTVPLITSVNGQWTFSLQPVMSVGAGESITSATVNGVGERAPGTAPPAAPAPPAPAPSATQPPALVPTGAPLNPPVTDATRSPTTELPPPPQLQQRPALQHPLAAGTEIGEMTAPSSAGPLTAKLNHNSIKLAEFFRHLLEESLVQVEDPTAETAALRLQLEQERWRYQHELAELRRTNEVALVEVRAAMDKEKTRAVAEARRLAHQELEAAVKSAKSKQWCANCSQEAQFYCCWNTSYCDYPCQRAHWGQHYAHCTQQRTNASSPPTVIAKVTSATTRTLNSDQTQNKSPVAVNAADEGNGHAAAKSAGASPQAAAPTHAAPLLANKQLMNNDDNAPKRVVTSGGYLIVGASAGAAGDARRAPRRD